VLDELLDDQPRPARAALARARLRDPRARPSAAHLAAVLRAQASDCAADDATSSTSIAPTLALRRHKALRLRPAVAGLLLVAVAVGLAVGSESRSRAPAQVRPVPHSDDTAQQAKSLSAWLKRYSEK
jgi:hypothetical protein